MKTFPVTRTVTIPALDDHDGRRENAAVVTLSWVCPTCGGPRGPLTADLSFDGSRRLAVDTWTNACGHIDLYSAVRAEAGHSQPVHVDDDF